MIIDCRRLLRKAADRPALSMSVSSVQLISQQQRQQGSPPGSLTAASM
jgi:hypothetical protein